jgi:hypothetical protein
MKLAYFLPFVMACAPESMQAITPRPSAAPVTGRDAATNRADEADTRLRESSEQATHIQDILEEPVHMQDEPVYIIWQGEQRDE